MVSESFCKSRYVSVLHTEIQTLQRAEIEVRQMKVIGRSDEETCERSKRADGIRRTAKTGGKYHDIEPFGIACELFEPAREVLNGERPVRIRCIVTRAVKLGDFVAAIEKQVRHFPLFIHTETVIQRCFRTEV